MQKLDFYWKTNTDWYHLDEDFKFVINDDAPAEARESYYHYLEQMKQNNA